MIILKGLSLPLNLKNNKIPQICQISLILQGIRIASSLRTMMKRIRLILETISREIAKLSLIEIQQLQDCNIFCYSFKWYGYIGYNKINLKL